jgi:hypothetical protein
MSITEERLRLEHEITELEADLAELQLRMPAHSVSPAMMLALDDLEERLAHLRMRRGALPHDDQPSLRD